MGKEIKIALPFYKLAYSICFIVIVSLVRGIVYTEEIGVALEAPVAILAIVFCSDTYVMEIMSKRWEVGRLYPVKNRVCSQYKRMLVQVIYLFFLSILGYGLFWMFQQPMSGILNQQVAFASVYQKESFLFLLYMAAIIISISFWGAISNVAACLFRNMWGGIGFGMWLWLVTNSKMGDQLLGKWNIFSYSFRNVENPSDLGWVCGKVVCVCLTIFCLTTLPLILKKRG